MKISISVASGDRRLTSHCRWRSTPSCLSPRRAPRSLATSRPPPPPGSDGPCILTLFPTRPHRPRRGFVTRRLLSEYHLFCSGSGRLPSSERPLRRRVPRAGLPDSLTYRPAPRGTRATPDVPPGGEPTLRVDVNFPFRTRDKQTWLSSGELARFSEFSELVRMARLSHHPPISPAKSAQPN